MTIFLVAASACTANTPDIHTELCVRADGTATATWTEGIAVSIGREPAEELERESRPLTPGAVAWWEVLRTVEPEVAARAVELARPFGLPAFDATIAAGNRGSSDAFAWGGRYIGINVEAFVEAYGPPDEQARERMARIVAHEYVHLLTYAYYPEHRELRTTPYERALWTLFLEGLGDYVSVSSRWKPDEAGRDSPVAERTLERLEPILVARLEALAAASADEEAELRAGISMGKFDEKWGSLPVALWLHAEARERGEFAALAAFIRAGPRGVLPLARRHAAAELQPRIEALMAF